MAGELVPLVLLPRYTTYAGKVNADQYFTTIAMDVTQYTSAIVNTWRGKIVGPTTPGFKAWFRESTDQVVWSLCDGAPGDPGPARPRDGEPTQAPEERRPLAPRLSPPAPVPEEAPPAKKGGGGGGR